MAYRSEKMEVSPDEKVLLLKWLEASRLSAPKANPPVAEVSDFVDETPTAVRKIIFDTDIGHKLRLIIRTDIDDALALLMGLHLPKEHIEFLGITTVYGYTDLRTMVANEIIKAYESGPNRPPGSRAIPVIRGEGVPIGTHRLPPWHTGTEGVQIKDFDVLDKMKEDQDTRHRKKQFDRAAPRFIIEQAHALNGELELVCLGALTNVAYALHMDPTIVSKIKRITYMGMGHRMAKAQVPDPEFQLRPEHEPMAHGQVYSFFPNHNLSCDTQAACMVFASGIPIDVINDTVTNEMWWGANPGEDSPANPSSYLMKLSDNKTDKDPPEAVVVSKLLEAWLYYRSSIFYSEVRGTCPHDGLTLAEAIYPGKFVRYVRGHLMIHSWAAFSTFVIDPKGPHRIGAAVNPSGFLTWFTHYMLPQFPLQPDYFEKLLNRKAERKKKAMEESFGKAKPPPSQSPSSPAPTKKD